MKLRQKLLAGTAAAVLAAGLLSPAATAQTSSALTETENPVATSSIFALSLGWFGWCLSSNVVNEGSCYF